MATRSFRLHRAAGAAAGLRLLVAALFGLALLFGLAIAAPATAAEDDAHAPTAADLVTTSEHEPSHLLGPLRIRDMTPFNLLRLDMVPAHAVSGGPGSWAIEADISYSNTFVMSDNVRDYLQARPAPGALTKEDADAILALGQDAYFVDGEFGMLDLTLHYGFTRSLSGYVTLSAYDFTGGILDGTIEGFHSSFGLPTDGRDLVERNDFQGLIAVDGVHTAYLGPQVDHGFGDPVLGLRHAWMPRTTRWAVVVDGAAKIAWRGERRFLSTGTNDYGLQVSLQGKFDRQGAYFTASAVRTDGRVFGVKLPKLTVPTLTAAYEVRLTEATNAIVQLYASQSTIQDTTIEELKTDKFQASIGLRTLQGRMVYGFAITENLLNFANTPDIGVSLNVAWMALRP
jgi:uncharacterized protein DUF3187